MKFRTKKAPEKQEIDLSFTANNAPPIVIHPMFAPPVRYSSPGAFIRIRHTERTWGVDLESLLLGFAKTLLHEVDRTKQFVCRNSGWIGFFVGAGVFLSAVYGSYITFTSFSASYSKAVADLRNSQANAADALGRRIDFITDVISSGAWPRLFFAIAAFLLTSVVAAIVLGIWVESKANKPARSFVLLTKAAEDAHKAVLRKVQRDWLLFGISVLVSIVTGIVSNILFTWYFAKTSW